MTDRIPSKVVDLIQLKTERYPKAKCLECPLLTRPVVDGYVESDDLDDIQAIYIAEHPGAEEARKGIPLCGQSGQVLELGVKAVEGDWNRSYRTNAVMCYPAYGDKVDKTAMECCHGRLEAELSELSRRNPDVKIMALGNLAAQAGLLMAGKHSTAKITTLRGGSIIVPKIGNRIYFSFNPAYILRSKQMSPTFVQDLDNMLFGRNYPFPKLAKKAPEVRHCVLPDQAIQAIKSIKPGPIALDIEASTAIVYDQIRCESGKLTALGLTDSTEYGYCFTPEVARDGRVQDALHELLLHEDTTVIAHNGKFDQLFLRVKEGIDIPIDFDTMLAHYALDENTYHDLKTLARDFLGVPDYDQEVEKYVYKKKGIKKVKWYDKVPYDVLTRYLAYDVANTLALYHVFIKRLKAEGLYEKPFLDPLMSASDLLGYLEERGLTVDIEYFESQVATVTIALAELTLEMRRLAGKPDLNPNSWQQVQPIMYDKFNFPKVSGKGFKPGSTSKPAIKKIIDVMRTKSGDETWTHPFLEAKLKYSRISKMNNAYIKPLQTWPHPETHRAHTTFNLHIAVTGRLSSTDPALQVIPRPTDKWGRIIRAGFVAGEGLVLCKIDQSQAELRVLAVESQDEYLLYCYNHGIDLHSAMGERVVAVTPQIDWSQQIVQPRSVAKIVNFGYAYDATAAGLASTFPDLLTFREAQHIHQEYDEKLFGAAAWKRITKQFAYKNGYVQTVFGRKRRFPAIADDNRARVGRQAVNYPIQSIASDLVLKAGVNLMKVKIPIVLLVHDEIIFECRPDEAPDMMNEVAHEMLRVSHEYSSDLVWKVDGSIRDRWAATTPEGEEVYEKMEWDTSSW